MIRGLNTIWAYAQALARKLGRGEKGQTPAQLGIYVSLGVMGIGACFAIAYREQITDLLQGLF